MRDLPRGNQGAGGAGRDKGQARHEEEGGRAASHHEKSRLRESGKKTGRTREVIEQGGEK
jgi:hypothetical protein